MEIRAWVMPAYINFPNPVSENQLTDCQLFNFKPYNPFNSIINQFDCLKKQDVYNNILNL